MVGLTTMIDQQATLGNLRKTKSPISGIPLTLYRQVTLTCISGSGRAGDRPFAAKLAETDQCEVDKCRDTFKHLAWECSKYAEIRKPYLDEIEKLHINSWKILEATLRSASMTC